MPQCLRASWKSAFTLAETLIVIGIIGVVAALTLPNLNHATGDKERVTKVKKIYSALTDAFDRAQVVYGDADGWFNDLGEENFDRKSERFAKRVTEFMKVSKDCGFDSGCFSSAPFIYWDGSDDQDNYLLALQNQGTYMVTLSDGISLGFEYVGSEEGPVIGRIRVDIDGPNKGKNQSGNDIFDFAVPLNSDNPHKNNLVTVLNDDNYPDSSIGSYGYLTQWVIQNGNLDYLKAAEDEEYNVKCPNGKTLGWASDTSCN